MTNPQKPRQNSTQLSRRAFLRLRCLAIGSTVLNAWRRGIQDVDYLTLAAEIDPERTAEIINEMIPKVLWEYGVSDPEDPSWVRTDISWFTDPDVWEATRAELADIIEGAAR